MKARLLIKGFPKKQQDELYKYIKDLDWEFDSPKDMIERAFVWQDTKEGKSYWYYVSMWYTYDYLIFLCENHGGKIEQIRPSMGLLIDQAQASGRVCGQLIWNPSPSWLNFAQESLFDFFFPLKQIQNICKN